MWGFGPQRPKRRDTWPSDMVITVDDHVQNLKLLLFVRQAWSLAQDLKIPELNPTPETGNSRIPESASRDVWCELWKHEWNRSWVWYDMQGTQETPLTQEEKLNISRPGQDNHRLERPYWAVEHGADGIDWKAFEAWDQQTTPIPPTNAELESVPALVSAWQVGLSTVIVLPYQGFYAHRLNSSHLVVSAETRNSPELYDKALGIWG